MVKYGNNHIYIIYHYLNVLSWYENPFCLYPAPVRMRFLLRQCSRSAPVHSCIHPYGSPDTLRIGHFVLIISYLLFLICHFLFLIL